MAKKRKILPARNRQEALSTAHISPEPEDEFYASKDHILVDEAPAAKRRRRLEEEMRELQPSDEEVLAAPSDDSSEDGENMEDTPAMDDDNDTGDGAKEGPEDGYEYWGPSASDYYNADAIETEADALEEEAEARRLRQRQLNRMTEADFGFDEMQWTARAASEQRTSKPNIVEKLPAFHIPDSATDEERWDIIRARYPEFEPLLQNLLQVHNIYQGYLKEPTRSKTLEIKIRAAGAYIAAVVMYISVLTLTKTGTPLPPSELRDHPVINTMLRCQQAWEAARNIVDNVANGKRETLINHNHPDPIVPPEPTKLRKEARQSLKKATRNDQSHRKSQSEFDDLDSFAPIPPNISLGDANSNKRVAKSKPLDIADLLAQANSAPRGDNNSYFGDEDPLEGEEAVEKARKKNSLRFYTSQIAQKANTRQKASRLAGGDDDLPYKERRTDRENRVPRNDGKETDAPEDHDVFDSDSEGGATGAINDEANEYYNSLVSASKQKKSEKHARANAHLVAAQQGGYQEEQVGSDGKRKITYAIEKNRGLAPKRRKEIRNPRVKKKLRYEQKMKKLGSMRPVYRGGEGKGGYGGELTGIKTNVVKSVKL